MIKNKIILLKLLLSCFLIMTFLFAIQTSYAQTGAFLKNTLTFTKSGAASLSFTTYSEPDKFPPTTLFLEIGSDDASTTLPSLPTLTFVLTKNTSTMSTSQTLTPGMSSWSPGNDETVTLNYGYYSVATPSSVPRLFRLDIAYGSTTAAALETWTLNITNFPAGSAPSARLIAFLSEPFGQFTSLTPLGQAGNVMAEVSVSTPTGTTLTFNAITTNVPAGATFNWIPEGDANASRQTISADMSTLTYNLEPCTAEAQSNCCCRNISYRFEVRRGSTVLASNRGVHVQNDLSGCSVTVDVLVSSLTATKVLFAAIPSPSLVVSSATYSWSYEGTPGIVTSQTCTSLSTCMVTLSSCTCCSNEVIYKVDIKKNGSILSSNRGVHMQENFDGCKVMSQITITPSTSSGAGTVVFEAAPSVTTGVTYTTRWIAEGDAVGASPVISSDGLSLTHTLASCSTGAMSNCCSRNIAYRFEMRNPSLAEPLVSVNRGVHHQKNLNGCAPPATQNYTVEINKLVSGNTVTFTATVTPTPPSGVTYEWFPEGNAIQSNGSQNANMLTYNLQACKSCCLNIIIYKVKVMQGTTLLATNRGVHKDIRCCDCIPIFECGPRCELQEIHILDRIWVRDLQRPWPWEPRPPWGPWPPWPWPGPDPCLNCPEPWKTAVPEGYIRKILVVQPIDGKGEFLGAGFKEQIQVQLGAARPIGPLLDLNNGKYLLAIEFKAKANPSVSVDVTAKGREFSSGKIYLKPQTWPGLLTSVLLGASGLANLYLVRRWYMRRKSDQQNRV